MFWLGNTGKDRLLFSDGFTKQFSTAIRLQVFDSLLFVSFQVIIQICDVLTDKYQSFLFLENVVQKQEKNEITIFFSGFSKKKKKMGNESVLLKWEMNC